MALLSATQNARRRAISNTFFRKQQEEKQKQDQLKEALKLVEDVKEMVRKSNELIASLH